MARCGRAPARGLNVVAGTPGGWVKCEVEVACDVDEDASVDVGAVCGAGWGFEARAGLNAGAVRGRGWGTGGTRGMAAVSEVHATEEGYGGAIA
jgi:hypothetical protein